jgi:hypothetical protein
MYGALKQATPQEVDAIRAASSMQVVDSMRALVADLDPIEALAVVYGLFEVLQPMIDETITKHRSDIKMPKGDVAYQLTISALAMTSKEREAFRQKRPTHLRDLKKTEYIPSRATETKLTGFKLQQLEKGIALPKGAVLSGRPLTAA